MDEGSNLRAAFLSKTWRLEEGRRWQKGRGLIGDRKVSIKVLRVRELDFQGKSVYLGGRRIIKEKKKQKVFKDLQNTESI